MAIDRTLPVPAGHTRLVSFFDLGTDAQDNDTGVVRIGRDALKFAKRGTMVRLTNKDTNQSIVRIIRRGVGPSHLAPNEIALQYDDRVALGLEGRADFARLDIVVLRPWQGIFTFFATHPSPLVRLEARLAWVMLILGTLLGALVGIPIGMWLP
jgi:hypothetical protein